MQGGGSNSYSWSVITEAETGTATSSRHLSSQNNQPLRERLNDGSKIGNLKPVSTLQSRVESYDSGCGIGQGVMDIDRWGALLQTCRDELVNDERMGTPVPLDVPQ